ncbi:MAG: DUF364 domain-containing protein [Pseudomonadota bacterium]
MTTVPSKPVPAQFVAVDVSSDQAQKEFDTAIRELKSLGWTVGGKDGAIKLIEADLFEPQMSDQPSIVVCASRFQVDRFDVVKPQAHDLLEKLGCLDLEAKLANSVISDLAVDKVLIGFNWTMVRAGEFCGIARSPSRDTEGARSIRPEHGFAGQKLRDTASYLCSVDPLSRSVGLAAINAYWNRQQPPDETDGLIHSGGGLSGIPAPGDGVVIVGGFRGAQKRLPKSRIVERQPKPGDISAEDAPKAFRDAKVLAITAQTLMNGSLEPILRASSNVPNRMLVGPSCPACPVILDYGLDEVFGAVIIDPDAAEQFIVESGTMIMLDHIARSRCLRRSPVMEAA